ncbi:hypothetical protein C8R45DRAFT_172178 [Mycena sanguinolenta]|nr:hypothetical protein C8R45DRAFT_172178 [Mycena sanguinolenta]
MIRTIDSTGDPLHRLIFSFHNPNTHPSILARSAACERVPCGVDHDLRILRYPVIAPLAGVYTPSSFQRPPICARPRAPARRSGLDRRPSRIHPQSTHRHARACVCILATIDAHDLHARLSVPPNMPPTASLFSISSSSTSSFARSHPARIAGGALLHAHGDLPPFPVHDLRVAYGMLLEDDWDGERLDWSALDLALGREPLPARPDTSHPPYLTQERTAASSHGRTRAPLPCATSANGSTSGGTATSTLTTTRMRHQRPHTPFTQWSSPPNGDKSGARGGRATRRGRPRRCG